MLVLFWSLWGGGGGGVLLLSLFLSIGCPEQNHTVFIWFYNQKLLFITQS